MLQQHAHVFGVDYHLRDLRFVDGFFCGAHVSGKRELSPGKGCRARTSAIFDTPESRSVIHVQCACAYMCMFICACSYVHVHM